MSRSVRRFVPILVVLAALAACAAPVPGAATPTGSAAGTAAPPTAVTDAPRVPNPRDVRGIAACDLLTPAQLDEFGLDPNTAIPATQGAAMRCEWSTRVGHSTVTISYGTEFNVNGLDGLYLQREGFPVFEPGQLDGFPTVRAERNDFRNTRKNYCTLYVGVADEQLVWAAVGDVMRTPPTCDTAAAVMSTVLTNLPPLS